MRLGALLALAIMLSAAVPPALAQPMATQQPGSAWGLDIGAYGPGASSNLVTVIAASPSDRFVGAVGGTSSLFVGLINGTVLRMDPTSGQVTGRVGLPDGNSAAHLTYLNGSVFVGTEWLVGAKDKPPFHVYKIDENTMKIVGQRRMDSHYANGFLLALNGYLWSGDGACTLYKINPNSLKVEGTVFGVAEDEFAFDGTYYWAECRNVVNVLQPSNGMLFLVATSSLPYPDRPRGFFTSGSEVYSSGSLDFTLYMMSLSGDSVVFKSSGVVGNRTYPTRDTFQLEGQLVAYATGPEADNQQMPARIHVYDPHFSVNAVVKLPGKALPSDASQHTLFALGGKVYFVTTSAVGYVDVPTGPRILPPSPFTAPSAWATAVQLLHRVEYGR